MADDDIQEQEVLTLQLPVKKSLQKKIIKKNIINYYVVIVIFCRKFRENVLKQKDSEKEKREKNRNVLDLFDAVFSLRAIHSGIQLLKKNQLQIGSMSRTVNRMFLIIYFTEARRRALAGTSVQPLSVHC